GNDHLVYLFDELPAVLPSDDWFNVESIVVGPDADSITMRVVEYGVGETLACGTGACAAALAAHNWGLVGRTVTVHQRGGDALVELRDDRVVLTGPARFVCSGE